MASFAEHIKLARRLGAESSRLFLFGPLGSSFTSVRGGSSLAGAMALVGGYGSSLVVLVHVEIEHIVDEQR